MTEEPPGAGGGGGSRRGLRELLARPELERLWTRVRERMEKLGGLRGSVRIEVPSDAERSAVANLLGLRTLPPADRPLRLSLARLDRALASSRFAVGLEEAMVLHGGPIRDRIAERAAAEERWERVVDEARRDPLVTAHPPLRQWLDELVATGLLRRLSRVDGGEEGELLERVFAVLRRLPARGARLAVLASETLGDSHALDPGHRVPALVLRALARLENRPYPSSAAERRELWARAGIECDDLSCDLLVLGLRPPGEELLHRTLRSHAEAGEPLRITLRQLVRSSPPAIAAGDARRVFVCENPTVVAVAADRLGASTPPLVCLDGYPNTAARLLLGALVEGGAELHYHGDFDWHGLRIANTLRDTVPFTPWRFTAGHYTRALATVEPLELAGQPVEATWDPELRGAMEEAGKALEEEAVVGELIGDLESGSQRR